MLLKELLAGTTAVGEVPEIDVSDIVYDSRKAHEGTMFVCIKGEKTDGGKFAPSAYEQGCRVFLAEDSLNLPQDAVVVKSTNARADLAAMSANLFGHPADELKIIGVTGTKGKTTVTYIIRSALENCGIKTGVIGTLGAFFGDTEVPTENTTPESYEVQKILRLMADNGCEAVCLEVSSLGLKMSRVDCIDFYAGIFTNLSPDHIGGGEHRSFEEYAYWKKQLYSRSGITIANIDDNFFDDIAEASKGEVISFGLSDRADFYAENIECLRRPGFLGIEFDCVGGGERWRAEVSMPGFFSVYNALAAIALLRHMDIPVSAIKDALKNVSVCGRVEIVHVSDDYDVIIDYAHNGISFENIIETMRAYKPNRIICLFGSAGGKAQVRRREIGLVSAKMSDFIILTNEDPDNEPPDDILDEIASAVIEDGAGDRFVKITDRAEAIDYALDHMQKGDILLLLGKGNERFMKIGGKKQYFNELDCIHDYMKRHNMA